MPDSDRLGCGVWVSTKVKDKELPHTEMTRLSQPCDKVVTTMSTLTRL